MSTLEDRLLEKNKVVLDRSEYGLFEGILLDGKQSGQQLGRNLCIALNKNNEDSPYNFAISQGGGGNLTLAVCDKNAGSGPQLPLMRIEMESRKINGQEAWVPTSLITAKDQVKSDGSKSELVDMMDHSSGQALKSDKEGLHFLGRTFEHLAHGGSVYRAMNHGLNGPDADDVLQGAKSAPIKPIQIDSKGYFSSVAEAKRETAVPVRVMSFKK